MKLNDCVQTPHGIAKITRIEDVYGSHDKRVSVEFLSGEKSQYSSSSLSPSLPKKLGRLTIKNNI